MEQPPAELTLQVGEDSSSSIAVAPSSSSTEYVDAPQRPAAEPEDGSPILRSQTLTSINRASASTRPGPPVAEDRNFQRWKAFVKHHRRILDARVNVEDQHKKFSDELSNKTEANKHLTSLLSDLQTNPRDPLLPAQVLRQSYRVRHAEDRLDAEGDQLRLMHHDLVTEEWALFESLPAILREDIRPEDMSSIVRKQGIDFRGEESCAQESSTGTSQQPSELEADSTMQSITSKLNVIEVLEDQILSLREKQATLMEEYFLTVGDDSEAGEKILIEIDRSEEQEKASNANLKLSLADLDSLRKPEEGAVVLGSKPRGAENDGHLPNLEPGSQQVQAKGSRRSTAHNSIHLLASLRRHFHALAEDSPKIFPSSWIKEKDERPDPLGMINWWLLHQLQASDENLTIYTNLLLHTGLKLNDTLSPDQVFDHAITEWAQDVAFKSPLDAKRHTTNRTLLGGSRVPFSNTASYNYQFARPPTVFSEDFHPLVTPQELEVPGPSSLQNEGTADTQLAFVAIGSNYRE